MRTSGRILVTALAAASRVVAAPAPEPTPAAAGAKPCTTGDPVVTSGYTIDYAWVQPTVIPAGGYEPDPSWSSAHVVGTQTFGVPMPVESGFAYAEFKCQYSCNSYEGSSYFIKYAGNTTGSYCSCFDDLLAPDMFVEGNQVVVGAFNAICHA